MLTTHGLLIAPHVDPVVEDGKDTGFVTASRANRKVWSCQPDGSLETRDEGTAGAYEKATRVGNLLIYRPVTGKIYVFLLVPKLPNA